MQQITAALALDLSALLDFSFVMRNRLTILGAFALILAGCVSQPEEGPSSTERALNSVSDGAGKAVTAPLDDLNLRRDKIPTELKAIKTPYSLDPEISCDQILAEVEMLNSLLGRDWDVPPPDKAKLEDRAADGASTAFLDTLASGSSGLIPYRGVVRSLTGADRHQKKVLRAYERGTHRRTFLKGIGLAKGCEGSAAPAPPPPTDPKVVFK